MVTARSLRLETKTFERALNEYLEESKLNPLAERQAKHIQNNLKWDQYESDSNSEYDFELCGVLTLKRNLEQDNDDSTSIGDENSASWICVNLMCELRSKLNEIFLFQIRSKASFVINKKNSTRSKRMIRRLSQDSYVKTLLCDSRQPQVLCEVNIMSSNSQMENRVHICSETLEGVKRASFSLIDSNLELMELLVKLPWLSLKKSVSCSLLANRAILLLLEDALVDACEEEGENDMIESLEIASCTEDAKKSRENKRAKEEKE